jgi:hypothetical protein
MKKEKWFKARLAPIEIVSMKISSLSNRLLIMHVQQPTINNIIAESQFDFDPKRIIFECECH